jgi:hypothetical protein
MSGDTALRPIAPVLGARPVTQRKAHQQPESARAPRPQISETGPPAERRRDPPTGQRGPIAKHIEVGLLAGGALAWLTGLMLAPWVGPGPAILLSLVAPLCAAIALSLHRGRHSGASKP